MLFYSLNKRQYSGSCQSFFGGKGLAQYIFESCQEGSMEVDEICLSSNGYSGANSYRGANPTIHVLESTHLYTKNRRNISLWILLCQALSWQVRESNKARKRTTLKYVVLWNAQPKNEYRNTFRYEESMVCKALLRAAMQAS